MFWSSPHLFHLLLSPSCYKPNNGKRPDGLQFGSCTDHYVAARGACGSPGQILRDPTWYRAGIAIAALSTRNPDQSPHILP